MAADPALSAVVDDAHDLGFPGDQPFLARRRRQMVDPVTQKGVEGDESAAYVTPRSAWDQSVKSLSPPVDHSTIAVPHELIERVRRLAGEADAAEFIANAVRRALPPEGLDEFLDEYWDEHGAPDRAVVDEVKVLLRPWEGED